jgi:hypothetical protein
MTLEESISDELGKEMADSIDWEIRAGMLTEMGWVKYQVPRFIDNHHAIDIGYWLSDNCRGEYERNGATFLFKESKDATMFILRWGS